MTYKVNIYLHGYSYINDVSFLFSERDEALDFAEIAQMKARTGLLDKVTIEFISEEA